LRVHRAAAASHEHGNPMRIPLHALGAALAAGAMPAIAQDPVDRLPPVTVNAAPSIAEKYQWPLTTESVTAAELADTVNVVNTEDALRYLPGLLVRKRHIGDVQAPMSTRTSGVGSSARSLIYADGLLLSALIGNNNTTASPRWGMVAPEEISRVDVMYGPFAAAYPGNSVGAVVEITTRMPQRFEASANVLGAWQDFAQYGTRDSYAAAQASATLGDRSGAWSWWLGVNHLDAHGQPLAFVTLARPAAPGGGGTVVSGAFAERNRTGAPTVVLGAGGIEHQFQDNLKVKLAYDVAPGWRASYTLGYFQHDDRAHAQTYLHDAAGNPVYAGHVDIDGYGYDVPASAFSNNVYRLEEEHFMHGLALRSSTGGRWEFEAVASRYDFSRDRQRTPTGALPTAGSGGPGTVNVLDGTGWDTVDVKAIWRPGLAEGSHHVTFGVHHDRYTLVNPRYATSEWTGGAPGALITEARGRTRTEALWLQDAWQVTPVTSLTLGGRYEWWRAYDGYNASTTPALALAQPSLDAARLSPKAAVAWSPAEGWLASAAFGVAYRFPTVTELYQVVATGPTLSVPNPDLRPEHARSVELALERSGRKGRVRMSLFEERLADALISQSAPLLPGSDTLFNFVQNVDRVQTHGVELVAERKDAWIEGLDLQASVTYADSRIRADAVLPAAVGKQTPQVPRWRYTLQATYRPSEQLSLSTALRYSDRVYATIDNSDVYTHTYQGFDSYLVIDARVNWRFAPRWSAALGIDNLNDRRYFLFHPFPQRTLVAELRHDF
jgi:iron complex outermembrane receptor protein